MTRPAARADLARSIASLGGAGRSPFAPGTAGTIATLPVAALAAGLLPAWGYLVLTLAVAWVAVWSADRAVRRAHSRDPGWVVIDEAAGMFVTLLFVPIGAFTLVAGFFLFRFMDVVKPWPAGPAERLPGGWGIVTDDLIAGLYANILVRVAATLYVQFLA